MELRTASNSKDAVNNILSLLEKLKQDEIDAQSADDAVEVTETADCESTIAELNQEISDAQTTISDNNNAVQLLQTAVSNSQSQLDEANDNLVTSTNALKNLQDARDAEHATFLQNTADISATITTLKAGRDIIAQLDTDEDGDEGSFVQKKSGNVFAQFTNHVMSSNLKNCKSCKYHGFINALVSLLSKEIVADQKLVNMVLHLIDQLVDQLSGELSTLGYNEKSAQDIFDVQSTNLESDIANLNSQIAQLQSEITANNSQILDYQADNANLDVTVQNKSQELADRTTSCADDEAAYEAIKEQRLFLLIFLRFF